MYGNAFNLVQESINYIVLIIKQLHPTSKNINNKWSIINIREIEVIVQGTKKWTKNNSKIQI
jgi:hypothetical protein